MKVWTYLDALDAHLRGKPDGPIVGDPVPANEWEEADGDLRLYADLMHDAGLTDSFV